MFPERGYPPCKPTRGLGSVVSSPSGVRGRSPGRKRIWCVLSSKERFWRQRIRYGIRQLPLYMVVNWLVKSTVITLFTAGRNIKMINCNMWRYTTMKAGQNRDRVRNSGQFSVPEDLEIVPGQAAKIRDYPGKIGTDGHFTSRPRRLSRGLHRCRQSRHTFVGFWCCRHVNRSASTSMTLELVHAGRS